MHTPVIIVGFGIAGANLAFALQAKGIDFIVIDEYRKNTSSKIAAGLYNPVTGKRVVKTWMADEIFPFADSFYKKAEDKLKIKIRHNRNVYRIFKDIADQNDIITKAYSEKYQGYLNPNFTGEQYKNLLEDEMGGIEVLRSGNLDIKTYLESYQKSLMNEGKFRQEKFIYDDLQHNTSGVIYGDLSADKIIFCEGYRAMQNPFFNWLPYAVTKGEMLRITTDLPRTHIINKGFFILPDKDEKTFVVGSSYERVINEELSEKGKLIVSDKLDALLKGNYEIVGQYAAVRPTVRDRRPFIGKHPEYPALYCFNGMGTKGVTLSPFFANQFTNHLFDDEEINKEANISRNFSLYSKLKKAESSET